MDIIRTVIRRISRHRVFSALSGIALVASLLFARTWADRYRGGVSEPLKRGAIIDAVYGIGTVTATRSYSIRPGVTSTIGDIDVREGDAVRRGAKLLQIDGIVYRAPFDGVVNFLPFKVGENIFTQIPVLVLTDLSNRYLVVSLEQQGALRVRAGQRAKLSFDSIREENFGGIVKSVYSYNGNFLARIDISSLPPEILPDMTADVAVVIREVKDALLIPVASFENGFVWVKRGRGIPSRVPVKLGIVDGAMAEVTSGTLQPNDTLIIHRKVAQ